MTTAMGERWKGELADVDLFPDPAVESLWAGRDANWVPPLTRRGLLYPVRTVMYLASIASAPKLKRPLKLEVSPTESGGFEVCAPMLDLSGIGDTLEAAAGDLSGTIASLWSELDGTPTERLAPDAVVLLRRLRTALL